MDYACGQPAELFRVYVATDRDCVNIVYRGAIVGSPAYAPRTTGPLALPQTDPDVAKARAKRSTSAARAPPSCSTARPRSRPRPAAASGTGPTGSPAPTPAMPRRARRGEDRPAGHGLADRRLLLDRRAGAHRAEAAGHRRRQLRSRTRIPIEYRESELPQDACQSGRVMRFGKTNPPVVTGVDRPFASGLSPKGRLTSAARATPSFYGTPLVAWQPALGAQEYEVQWSRTANPFKPVASW